jgi:Protein of unknown function (DUF3302)
MDSSVGVLDVFAFFVFAVLIFVGVIIVVSLGKLPGQLARKWNHPQTAAITAMSWIGIATGGLLWPIAFIWAFTTPFGAKSTISKDVRQPPSIDQFDDAVTGGNAPRTTPGDKERRS